MRVLALTSRVPFPPLRGDKVRTCNFLRALAEGHEVDLLTFAEGEADRALARELTWLGAVETIGLPRVRSYANMALGLLSPLPYQTLYYRSRAMRDALACALERGTYDLVYVHLFRMAPFALALGRVGTPGAPVFVLDLTDAISVELSESVARRPVALRPAYRWEAAKIRRYEARVAGAFDETWVIADADADAILAGAPGANVVVVPNGVDESLFSLPEAAADPIVLFVGNLSIAHNVDAVEFLALEIMPLVRRRVPEARLRVVGHGADERMRRIAAEPGIELAGHVPELADAYSGAAVFAAPLRFAAGIQNKIIEAMAAGLPVVTTPTGNRGLGAPAGEALAVAGDADRLSGEIVGFLEDRARRASIGAAGRAFVRARFSWSAVRERAERLVLR